MISGNLFELIPQNLNDERFDTILENPHVKIERIVSKGHTSPETGWYEQAQNEWVLLMLGKAVISYEGGRKIHLEAGDHVFIPAHEKHKVSWTDPTGETIWLAVHYADE